MVSLILYVVDFCKTNLKPLLISLGVGIVLFFIVGFFTVRDKLHNTEAQLAATKARLSQIEDDVKRITQTHVEMAKQVEQYREKSDALAKQLERRGKKSISELSRRHAKLVEKAINKGTEKVFKCVEVISSGGDC